jgi:actin-related protein
MTEENNNSEQTNSTIQALVFDNGTDITKTGFSGDDKPRFFCKLKKIKKKIIFKNELYFHQL